MTPLAFLCAVSLIYDADTLTCADATPKTSDNVRVRLAGISSLERDGSCNAPACSTMPAVKARRVVAAIIGPVGGVVRLRGAEYDHLAMARPYTVLECTMTGRTKNRREAWCRLPDRRDLSCAIIGTGAAVRWVDYDSRGRLKACR